MSDQLETDGGVSLFTGEPFVSCRVGGVSWQWTPAEARDFAVLLIRTAAAAEDDAILVELGPRDGDGEPGADVGRLVQAVRAARDRRWG